jgi:Ca-activated chloride channel family protein
MDPVLPIHVVSYMNQNYNYYWFGGRSYHGNEYFYLNITRLTSANYFDIFNWSTYESYPFSDILTSCFQSLGGFISSFDLHTKLNSGFCFGRYNLNQNSGSVYLNKPFMQIGKFMGTFPFEIQISGIYKSEPFTQTFNFEEADVINADSLTEEMWAGNYIKFLENQTQSNDIVNEIVDFSINERVLSIYSAFLCLEPGRGGEVCYDCLDESEATEVKDTLLNNSDSLSLGAYPNPFNSQINLNVKLPASFSGENITFRIYDILGQIVKTFEPDLSAGRKEYRFTWNGVSDNGVYVSSGNYFFIVTTPEKIFTKKLLLLK